MMTRDSVKQLRNLSDNDGAATWHPSSHNCLIVQFYEREVEAESKILNLLFHTNAAKCDTRKDTECNRSRAPTDAEIIFGDCDCGYLFCNRGCTYGWGRSRIDWLWELEKRQQQLHDFQLYQNSPKKSKPPTDDDLTAQKGTKATKATPNKKDYWKWLRFSCICSSDTESYDLPYCKSTCV